jgi:steroid delta-isomerase-like uncharacterized protein
LGSGSERRIGVSAEENANLARELHQAFNDRNYDRVDELVTQDVEWENVATGETFPGPEGVKQFMRSWVDAFSDGKTEIQELHAGEDFAVNEFAGRGTHDGTLRGPAGEIPPTNQSVDVQFCEVYHIQDGKISHGRTFFDAATMMGQLGVIQPG